MNKRYVLHFPLNCRKFLKVINAPVRLALPGAAEIEFDPPRLTIEILPKEIFDVSS